MTQAKKTGTHSLIQNHLASRYSYFPISLNQDRSRDKSLSVWMWSVILCFDTSAVSMSVYACFKPDKIRVCRAAEQLNLWQ